MRRRLAILVLIIMMSLTGLAATPLFQIGPAVTFEHTVLSDSERAKDINSYGFGGDVRLNLFSWVSLDVPFTYSFGGNVHTIGTKPSVNLNIPAAGILDIALGLALDLDFQYDASGKSWYINGNPVSDYSNAMMGASLAYRLALTLNLGMLSIGAAASVPMEGTFDSFNGMPSWSETNASVFLLFNFL